MNTKHTRLTIFEAISDMASVNIVELIDRHVKEDIAMDTMIGSRILLEYDGRMVVFETDWSTWEGCLTYHSSRGYRALNAQIVHFTIGEPVIKLFFLH